MGERTQYAPGTFSWCDLSTTDQDGAKEFYSALFGWNAVDHPMGGAGVYSIMQLEGRDVAAISGQPTQQAEAGVPPLWNSYVTVTDVDASLQHARELGANVHAPAFDVMDAGRMAVIQDPQGAYFMLWQPNAHIGAGLVNAPGALVWNELHSPDVDGSASFYGELFGWETQPIEGMPQLYLAIKNGAAANGGICGLDAGGQPNWLVYFGAEDIDVGLARAQELGATALSPVIDIQTAKFVVLRDPQGAVFALYAGQLEP